MAIYAIGDIQGCFDDLMRLVDHIQFDPKRDRLWFVGDLVNRGPKSLETLRYIKGLGSAAITVLGNHDLHLLAVANDKKKPRKKDSLHQVLMAPDCEELLDWLRHRPLLHYQYDYCLVHAGLPPQWDIKKAQKMAHLAERILQGPDFHDFLSIMYGNLPNVWSSDLKGNEKTRFIINALTRMRYCTIGGKLDFKYNNAPGSQPDKYLPWFKVPGRKNASVKIVFGHWSTLGFYAGDNCFALDTGCLWGRQLTALRINGGSLERFSIASSMTAG